MSRDVSTLEGVQHWMQSVVVAEAEIGSAADALVKPSWSLAPAERVAIYRDMYPLRMVEALESDYPALRHHLGEESFGALVQDYVARWPSRSYTLNRLGDRLPEFLEAWGAPEGREFRHDLARTELAITEAFDAPESAPLDTAALAAVPEDAWERARLRPIAALRLLDLRYAVSAHLDAQKHDRIPPRPRRRRTFVLVYRKDYAVRRQELSRAEHDLLAGLLRGEPLGRALEAAIAGFRARERADRVFACFRRWVAAGLFAAVDV